MEDAWGISRGKSSTIVAVVDTGVQMDHPDLQRNQWVNTGEHNNGTTTAATTTTNTTTT